jgi:hypothetical protein
MRSLWIGIAALLLGMVAGGWGPRGDLRAAKDRIATLEKELKNRPSGRGNLSGVTEMLRLPATARRDDGPHGKLEVHLGSQSATTTNAPPHRRPGGPFANSEERRKRMRDGIESAMDAWKLRSDLARNSFVSNVATNPDQAVQFDVLMAAMNLRLSNSISQWVQNVGTNRDITPETGIRMAHDLSGAIVVTYDELDRSLPEGWRGQAGNDFALFNFINPSVALPLVELNMRNNGDDSDSTTVP